MPQGQSCSQASGYSMTCHFVENLKHPCRKFSETIIFTKFLLLWRCIFVVLLCGFKMFTKEFQGSLFRTNWTALQEILEDAISAMLRCKICWKNDIWTDLYILIHCLRIDKPNKFFALLFSLHTSRHFLLIFSFSAFLALVKSKSSNI